MCIRDRLSAARLQPHLADDLVEPAANGPVRHAQFALHVLDVAAMAHEEQQEGLVFGRQPAEGTGRVMAAHDRIADGAAQFGDGQRAAARGAGFQYFAHVVFISNIVGMITHYFGVVNNNFDIVGRDGIPPSSSPR